MTDKIITHELLNHLLNYNSLLGVFTWKNPQNRNKKINTVAGSFDKDGYIQININKKVYKAHRLAWFYVYKEWPKNQIDHINRIKNDNSIKNLRDVTFSENGQNKLKQKNNTSGHKGINFSKEKNKWRARIKLNKKEIHLGYFVKLEDAIKARKEIESKLHTHSPIC